MHFNFFYLFQVIVGISITKRGAFAASFLHKDYHPLLFFKFQEQFKSAFISLFSFF